MSATIKTSTLPPDGGEATENPLRIPGSVRAARHSAFHATLAAVTAVESMRAAGK